MFYPPHFSTPFNFTFTPRKQSLSGKAARSPDEIWILFLLYSTLACPPFCLLGPLSGSPISDYRMCSSSSHCYLTRHSSFHSFQSLSLSIIQPSPTPHTPGLASYPLQPCFSCSSSIQDCGGLSFTLICLLLSWYFCYSPYRPPTPPRSAPSPTHGILGYFHLFVFLSLKNHTSKYFQTRFILHPPYGHAVLPFVKTSVDKVCTCGIIGGYGCGWWCVRTCLGTIVLHGFESTGGRLFVRCWKPFLLKFAGWEMQGKICRRHIC